MSYQEENNGYNNREHTYREKHLERIKYKKMNVWNSIIIDIINLHPLFTEWCEGLQPTWTDYRKITPYSWNAKDKNKTARQAKDTFQIP